GLEIEMIQEIEDRVVRVGMGVVALREEHRGAKKLWRAAPPFREHRALDLEMLHPFRIRRQSDGRQHMVELQLHVVSLRRIEMDLDRLAHEIVRGKGPSRSVPVPLACP